MKRYVSETGRAWVQACVGPTSGNRIYLARITAVEVMSAIARRRRGGSLSAAQAATNMTQFRNDLATDYLASEISPKLIDRAMALADAYTLRAYDAVQLAAVEEVHADRNNQGLPPVALISADLELNAAAAAIGISVEDPNSHP